MRLLHPFIAVAALALGGCSALLDFDCANDGDCANLEGYICESGACVERQAPEVCGGEAMINSVCTEFIGPLVNSPDSTTVDRVTAYLSNPDDYVLVAVHTPNGKYSGQAAPGIRGAVRLAVDQVNKAGGLGEGKELAALICVDGASTPQNGIDAGLHAARCGAKALIGTVEDAPTLRLFNDVAKEVQIPVISPGSISPEIEGARSASSDADQDLLWRIKVPGDTVAETTGRLVRDLDSHRQVVVLGRQDDPYSESLLDALDDGMCRSSLFCNPDQGGATVTPYLYQGGSDAATKADVLDFLLPGGDPIDADLIITLAPNLDDLLQVLLAVTDWGGNADLITVEGARSGLGLLGYTSSTLNNAWVPVACRAVGISSGTQGRGRATWEGGIALANRDLSEPIEVLVPTPAYVDATYITALAISAALFQSSGEVTTQGLVAGLQLLSDANAEEVFVDDWANGLRAITSGTPGMPGTLNYVGASGEIDLNPATRDVSNTRVEMWTYALGNGDPLRFDIRNAPGSLNDDANEIDLSQRDQLVRSIDAVPPESTGIPASDPLCAEFPYLHVLPNPPEPPQE